MKSYIGAGVQYTDDHHTGVPVAMEQIDDGRWHHRFGASWLKTTDICLERARREHAHPEEEWETDAACIGTAMHTAIETCLYEYQDGTPLSRASTLELWNDEFSELMALENFRWVKYTEKSARTFGEKCTGNWYDEVLPTLPQESLLETKFRLPLIDNDKRVVELSGCIDYIGTKLGDWKTSSRGEYQMWEYKRWAVQPTVYTWAAVELGLWPQFTEDDDNVPFEYIVMHRNGVQRFDVTRSWSDWSFLRDKVSRIVELIEADVPAWPLNDNQALCSAKWCPAWDKCKGAHGIEF